MRFNVLAAVFLSGCATQSNAPINGVILDVVIGGFMGEMMNYLSSLPMFAFVGGSLIKRGGHKPIEPALLVSYYCWAHTLIS